MPFSALDVRLGDDYITVGPVAFIPRGKAVSDLIFILGAPSRSMALEYSVLHIYDHLGLRFWAKNGVVSEFQIVLETEDHYALPSQAFVGLLQYRGQVLIIPVPGSLFSEREIRDFVQDTDPLQYGVVTYDAKLPRLTYSATMSKRTGNLQYLSIV